MANETKPTAAKLTIVVEAGTVFEVMEALFAAADLGLPGPETPGSGGEEESDDARITWRWE